MRIFLIKFEDDERYLVEGVNEEDARGIMNCEFNDEFTVEEVKFEGGIYEIS